VVAAQGTDVAASAGMIEVMTTILGYVPIVNLDWLLKDGTKEWVRFDQFSRQHCQFVVVHPEATGF
jgi:hypothetical protein